MSLPPPVLFSSTPDSVTLEFAFAHGPPYLVEYRSNGKEWQTLGTFESTMIKKKHLSTNDAYEFRYSSGESQSQPLAVQLSESPAAVPPRVVKMELALEDSSKAIANVEWDAPGSAIQFELAFRPCDGITGWTSASDTLSNVQVRKKNLVSGMAYTFRVRSFQLSSDGTKAWGPWSASSTPPARAPRPSLVLPRLLGKSLLVSPRQKAGMADPASLSRKAIALYFSASWCGPCRQFTPQLAAFYEQMKALGKEFEVVFVSCDRDQASFKQYFEHEHPWLAVPFEDDRREALAQEHRIKGIPSLRIMDDTGRVIDDNAMQRPLTSATVDAWVGKAVEVG
jgi:thiol-disulfide isomerase/thioredoxin